MEQPLISIIVLSWNGKQYLKNCLDSCFFQTYNNLEVIVVDNASTDGTADYVKKNYPNARLVVNKKNLGFAEGNNVGIRAARGEWIFILNNDTKLNKNCIRELYSAIKEKPKVGMASPRIYFSGNGIDTLGLQLYKRGYTVDLKELKQGSKLLAPCGAAAFYSRKMLDSIKIPNEKYDYFDSDYFIYAEDFDLGLRAQLAGWRCIHASNAKLQHLHGATMDKFSDNQVFFGDRNRSWTIIKNYPSKVFWRYLHWFILVNFFTLVKWTFRGKLVPIIRSKISMILSLQKMLKKRKYIQRLKKTSNKEFEKLLV